MKGVFQNLVGIRSGRVVVVEGPLKHPTTPGAHWQCVCDCGERVKTLVSSSSINRKTVRSCGCLTVEQVKKANRTHGMTLTPTYVVWKQMWQRCTNPKHKSYASYRDRVPVERWRVFELFLEDMGERPPGLSLDRIDNSKGYSPDNCRWVDARTQQGNTVRNIRVTVAGTEMCLKAASRLLGIPYSVAKRRCQRGWTAVDAVTTPVRSISNNICIKEADDVRSPE